MPPFKQFFFVNNNNKKLYYDQTLKHFIKIPNSIQMVNLKKKKTHCAINSIYCQLETKNYNKCDKQFCMLNGVRENKNGKEKNVLKSSFYSRERWTQTANKSRFYSNLKKSTFFVQQKFNSIAIAFSRKKSKHVFTNTFHSSLILLTPTSTQEHTYTHDFARKKNPIHIYVLQHAVLCLSVKQFSNVVLFSFAWKYLSKVFHLFTIFSLIFYLLCHHLMPWIDTHTFRSITHLCWMQPETKFHT